MLKRDRGRVALMSCVTITLNWDNLLKASFNNVKSEMHGPISVCDMV